MRNVGVALLLVLTASMLFTGCSKITPEPQKPCETARECAEIRVAADKTCKAGGFFESEDSYWMANNHPSRRIFVTYEETVRHINSPEKDLKTTKMISVDPGKMKILGCWRTKGLLDERFNEYSYSKQAACFSDQCPAPGPQKPTTERDPQANCSDLCDQGHESCLVADISGSVPMLTSSLTKLNWNIIKAPLPASIDMAPLANLVNISNNNTDCKRTSLDLRQQGAGSATFLNTGSTCQLTASISQALHDQFRIEFPGEWTGGFQRTSTTFALVANSLDQSPMLWVRNASTKLWASDELVALESASDGSSFTWTFTANKYYCARIVGIPRDARRR